MRDKLLKMNRQTGEFQAYYSKSSTSWYKNALNTWVILVALAATISLLIWYILWYLSYTGPEHILGIMLGITFLTLFVVTAVLEDAFYKEVPVEPKQLLDSSVNPYFVMYLPIRGRRGETYFYIEDKDNAYVLDAAGDFFNWLVMSTGKRYLVVDGSIKMIDFEFCSKTASEIEEIIADKYAVFVSNSIKSVRKRNKLYKAMMTEICS